MKQALGNADKPNTHRREPEIEDSRRLAQSLARRSGLNDVDLKRIAVVQAQLGLGFIEAAMRMGLINQGDLDAVMSGGRPSAAEVRVTAKPSEQLLGLHDPFEPFSEAIRALRTELLMRAPEDDADVLAVMSSGPREGRSRLAAELGIAFSQLGQATLLVDCDLRRPRQHELFTAENDMGLAHAISQGSPPKIQAVAGLPELSILTAGSRPSTPLEILSSHEFGELLTGWRRRYRHVILDTPAVSEFSDALAVAAHAERVLLISRTHHSSLAKTRDAVRRLESSRAVVVGCVMNTF